MTKYAAGKAAYAAAIATAALPNGSPHPAWESLSDSKQFSWEQQTMEDTTSLAQADLAAADITTIYGYFTTKLGVTPNDESLQELPVDSNCGDDCVRSIDAYAALLQVVDPHSRVVGPLIDSANAQVEVLWNG